MKKFLFLTVFSLISLVSLFAGDGVESYPDCNTLIYRYGDMPYQKMAGDRHDVVGSAVASAFIPGLGECLNGEWGRGMAKFGFGVLALSGAGASVALFARDRDYYTAAGIAMLLVFGSAVVAVDVWSVLDAIKIAKVKNLYERDNPVSLSVMPSFNVVDFGGSRKGVAGVSLALTF